MANRLVELRYSGMPNRAVSMPDSKVEDCWVAIAQLERAAVAKDACWRCTENDAASTYEYVVSYEFAGETEYAFVTDTHVISSFKGTLDDPDGTVRAILAPLLGALVADAPAAPEGAAVAGTRRCSHPVGHHKYPARACQCGSPDDADPWLRFPVCEASNCFNYAVKDVWCGGLALGQSVGASPRSKPVNRYSYDEWAEILATDGILRANDLQVPAGAPDTGWHIALTVSPDDIHFLRLDGEYWAHKFSLKPPQRCDTNGAVIPRGELRQAHLCKFAFVGYFFVPFPLNLDR